MAHRRHPFQFIFIWPVIVNWQTDPYHITKAIRKPWARTTDKNGSELYYATIDCAKGSNREHGQPLEKWTKKKSSSHLVTKIWVFHAVCTIVSKRKCATVVANSISKDIVHMRRALFRMQIQIVTGICLQHIYHTHARRVRHKLDVQWTELANYSQGTSWAKQPTVRLYLGSK